jgi:TPR repeat protein
MSFFKKCLLASLGLIGCIAFSYPAKAEDMIDALNFYYTGNHAKALKIIKPAAEEGDETAQYLLGRMYMRGEAGLKVNYQKALELFESAAEMGNGDADVDMAEMYTKGLGVKKDNETALKLLNHAVDELSSERAATTLGMMYLNGQGVSQDYKKARQYFTKGSSNPDALYQLGKIYEQGLGVSKDIEKAADYFKTSANNGGDDARLKLGAMFESGNGVKKNEIAALAVYLVMIGEKSSNGKEASARTKALKKSLPSNSVKKAQQLSGDMSRPSNFSFALDAFLNEGKE